MADDLSCVEDCTEDFRTVTGRRAHLEAIARRWTTDRGTLIGDPNYGTNLGDYINDDMGPADLANVAGFAEAEALKDERTLACDVTVTLDVAGTLTMSGLITDVDGQFAFAIADISKITAATLELTS